jgi:hypothetical protein
MANSVYYSYDYKCIKESIGTTRNNLDLLFRVSNAAGENGEVRFHLWQTRRVIDLTRTRVAA